MIQRAFKILELNLVTILLSMVVWVLIASVFYSLNYVWLVIRVVRT